MGHYVGLPSVAERDRQASRGLAFYECSGEGLVARSRQYSHRRGIELAQQTRIIDATHVEHGEAEAIENRLIAYVAEEYDAGIDSDFGIVVEKQVKSIDKGVEPLDWIVEARGAENQASAVGDGIETRKIVQRLGHERLDRKCVRNDRHRHIAKQRRRTGTFGRPVADSHKMNRHLIVELLLLPPDLVAQVGRIVGFQELTAAATVAETAAFICVVADAGHSPHIVHSPGYRLSHSGNAADSVERQQSLVYPGEIDDIGLGNPRMAPKRHSMVCHRHFEKIATVKIVPRQYSETLHGEIPSAYETRA